MTVPPRIRARHIFIATLGTPSDKARQTLEGALAELTAGTKKFAALAAELSTDTATNAKGGDLGWMSRERLPVDFGEQVFRLGKNAPTLVRTKLGWHIVEVTETKAASQATLEEIKPEIIAALSAAKRHQAVTDFRTALRKFETAKIDIFHDQLAP